ncbi:magnesium transporter [Corynebacterium hansenii]|uniref:Magnesium transporter MgtE n=1 Tax=Corynebacterium hansenii TaxID=394964 RepID=A0ABV7ZQI6_9CORY|nr:magnesium transporter [Corynebacterium hansenii]WJZ01030.1 Magnesium transporter MgtE [Corynebacterium hansenii]
MTTSRDRLEFDVLADHLALMLAQEDLASIEKLIRDMPPSDLVNVLEREDPDDRAIIYRLLPRELALEVFDRFNGSMRAELLTGLRDEHVVGVFEHLDPDDRAALVDELPASVSAKLFSGLSEKERKLTAPMLGYPSGAIGRHMSTEYVRVRPGMTAREAIAHVRATGEGAETVYLLMVTDDHRRLEGVVGLRDLIFALDGEAGGKDGEGGEAAGDPLTVRDLMKAPESVTASEDAETAARRAVRTTHLVTPVVDEEGRLIGILTIDDANRIIDRADEEDAARAGASEPLDRPYLVTSVATLVRSRIVWLLVLALSAILTVQVLEMFEDALAKVVTLSLFIPLLTGTAGNTGSQAATTVTRALAVGEVRLRDTWKVAWREVRVGVTMGVLLGLIGAVVAGVVYGLDFGLIIGLTLVSICTIAATVGGIMPMIARAIKADPAVFSTPFISTFCDASGLIVYFLIAKAVLGL